ncbi:hypothetical protein QFC22_004128 [Naganishia vaughanmartiniae]|uniref:Uncharacterized protein n=1 Tax=Naganishia vaughanmartiniae TaxID=1424756 RepID=A0ACC2X3I6_9TREE|nr:hypothetical protein QFC22_004128 [Naganishia vaughanmartiniae]
MTQKQTPCASRKSPQSPVFSDCPVSPTLIMAVPTPNTLPYAIVSHERIHSAHPYSALPATSPSVVVENRYEASTYDKTAQPAAENFWASGKEHDHKRNDRDIGHLLQKRQSFEGADNCQNVEMADTCGRHQHGTSCCLRHSETCLFSSPGFFRPLPSPDRFTAPVEMQQGTPPSMFASLPLFNDLYRPNSTHPSSRPLPQLRTPSYGIQTSHVRDLPRYTPLGTRDAIGNEDTTFRMKIKNLPPIQTVLDGIAKPAHQTDVSDSKDDYWNDQPCFKYLSYPSTPSSLDAAIYKTPPTDSLAPYLTSRKNDFYGGATLQVPRRDGRTKAYVQAVQIDSPPQHANGTPVDTAQKQWTVQDHARLTARVWNKRNTPSSFTSSDIERASSVESQFDQENQYEPESETTIFLGDFCATSPRSSSLISTDARLSYSTTSADLSVYTQAEHHGSSIMLSSPESTVRHSTSGEAMQEPFPGSRRVHMRPPSAAPMSSGDSNSSGSDYEVSVMRKKPGRRPNTAEAKTRAKPPSMKIRKQENAKNKKAPEVARNKKHSRRSGQRKTSLSTSKERSFKCDYCPMAFHRRHDMKVSKSYW